MKKTTKRLGAMVLALAMALGLLCGEAWAARSGKCGKNLRWTLSGSTLTVSGKGAMYNYDNDAPRRGHPKTPWYKSRKKIRRVVVRPGVTRVGSYAFDGCKNLTRVTLPTTLKTVGRLSFASCGSLKKILIPKRVKKMGDSVFFDWNEKTDVERSALKKISFVGNAPRLYNREGKAVYGTLESVAGTARIPAGNRTWTKAKRKKAGGRITWKKWNPYTTKVIRVTPGRRKATVRWKRNRRPTGFQIQYATNKKFRDGKIRTVKGSKRTAVTLKNLKGKKKYYFRVRTYKVDAKKRYYSVWSGAKAATVRR